MICGSDFYIYNRQSIGVLQPAAGRHSWRMPHHAPNVVNEPSNGAIILIVRSVYLLLCLPSLPPQSPFLTFAPSHTLSLSLPLPRALDTHIFRL